MMDLLEMLNRNRDLMWGDPDKPDDDEAVVHLCALAADEIVELREQLAEAKKGTARAWKEGWYAGYHGLGDMEAEWSESATCAAIDEAGEGE